jgi:hypothetical protein
MLNGQSGIGEDCLILEFLVTSVLKSLRHAPTTGKTVFLSFVLLQRILDAKPTVLCHYRHAIAGFSRGGVKIFAFMPGERIEDWDIYPNGTWALVDHFKSSGAPTGGINTNRFFPIFSATPEIDIRWDYWQKQRKAAVRYMKPWSWEECQFFA